MAGWWGRRAGWSLQPLQRAAFGGFGACRLLGACTLVALVGQRGGWLAARCGRAPESVRALVTLVSHSAPLWRGGAAG